MVKTIKVADKSFNMKASANTPFKYAEITNNQRDFFKDMQLIKDYDECIKKGDVSFSKYGDVIEFVYCIAYTMVRQYDKEYQLTLDEFRESIEDLGDGKWIAEVLQLAMSTFPRAIPNSSDKE